MSDFPKNLKIFRKNKKFTQKKLAKKLNYGYTAIANYESGRNEPSFDDLIALAEILAVTPNELLGFQNQNEDSNLLLSFKKLQPDHQKIILDMIDALQP